MNTKLEKVLSDLESASEELKNSVKKTRIESRRLQEALSRCNERASYHKVAITSNEVADISTPAKGDQSIGKSDSSLKLKTGATPGAYGVRLASELFTEDELPEGIISPQKTSTRTPLDSEKVNIIKSYIESRFGNKWEEAIRTINQKGRDLKKLSATVNNSGKNGEQLDLN